MTPPEGERRKMPDPSLMAMQIETLRGDFSEVKTAINALTEAISRLSLIEERQSKNQESIDRVYVIVDKIDIRVHEIEKQLPVLVAQSNSSSRWIAHVITGVLAVAGTYAATKLELLPLG